MFNMFPENSYTGTCSCGAQYMAPKGTLHCSNCLYKEIEALKLKFSKYVGRIDKVITKFGIQSCINDEHDLEKSVKVFSLKQQAEGVEDAIHNSPSRLEYSLPLVSTMELYSYAQQLRKQAEEL